MNKKTYKADIFILKSSQKKFVTLLFTLFALLSFSSVSPLYSQTNINHKNFQSKFTNFHFGIVHSAFLMIDDFQIDESLFKKDTNIKKPGLFDPPNLFRKKFEDQRVKSLRDPKGYSKAETLDSTGESVKSQEKVNGLDLTPQVNISLDDYLRFRKAMIQKQIYDSLSTKYDMKKALSKGDLAKLMATSTGLSIPIPPNPLMGIFGKPEINLNVNGEVNVRLGWRWNTQNLGTVSAFGQTQSFPVFNQDIRVNVNGSIGDKFKIGTDWNTRRNFDRDNKFKVGFDGYDDDIVKKFEFGNVNLPLPTQLITGGQTLFGIRSDYQFGPLYLKTILAQKKGEKKFLDIKGGVSRQPFSIRAYDYAQNHFFLDTVYKRIFQEYYKNATPIIPTDALPNAVTGVFEVYESTNLTTEPKVANVLAFAELPALDRGQTYPSAITNQPIQPGLVEAGRFVRLDSNQYRLDRNLGHLTIYNLKRDRNYAVAYTIQNKLPGESDDKYVGYLSGNRGPKDTLILKLIYRPNLQPGFKTLWSRQMKNVYSINATNVSLADTKIGLWYTRQSNDSTDVLTGSNDKIVTIFGVDKVDGSGNAKPDGQFDLGSLGSLSPYFDPIRGEITFPSVEPFRQGLIDYFTSKGTPSLADPYIFNDIYDTTDIVARRNTSRDRFMISGEVTASGRSAGGRISLGAFNLQPGSVRVLLDNVQLKEYSDYVIDYYTGTLQIKNDRATQPGANLRIEYEQQDIFQVSTKTLAGVRADYSLFKNRTGDFGLGFTFMHYNQSAVVDRATLGQEPIANTMLGLDFKLHLDAPWLTKALDYLPFYDTKAQSTITLTGEWAMVLPEPNKRVSTVASDNGEPVVYIDDFEGAQRYISLGLNPSLWEFSSSPVDSNIAPDPVSRAMYRGKLFWFKYFIPRVPVHDVYPDQPTWVGKNNIAPLEISFDANTRGIYNPNTNFLDKFNPRYDTSISASQQWVNQPENKSKIWGGMTRLLSSFNTNFDTENIEFIELMMSIDAASDNPQMYIDLGQISEDIIPNGYLNTEDGCTAASPIPNGRIDDGEDRGIDTLFNASEKDSIHYKYPLNLEDDPARDDYSFDFGKNDANRVDDDFRNYNNYENNAKVTELGQFPDKEILNDNNGQIISLADSYFRYQVNLNTDPKTNPQIVGGSNSWHLYRIPIRHPNSIVGNPLYSNIQYIRVSFKGGSLKCRIADWRLLGSQWQRISNFQSNVSPNDSILQVAFVNVFENSREPDFYTMPPGVQAPRQLNTPDPTVDSRLNEQSLSVCVNNLPYGQERMAIRIFPKLDLFYYKTMKFFIHGDGSMPNNVVRGQVPKAYAYVRFGTDSANYYEYRRPIVRDWQDIAIDLAELTSIKQKRDTSSIALITTQYTSAINDPLAKFGIKGTPILTKIQFFGVGISNPAERFPNELTTCMWINELRLISPERSKDMAAVASADIKFADLGSMKASFQNQQPNFHKLEERFGNRATTGAFTVTMQGNLEKFAPTSFVGMAIPIAYTHAETNQDPKYAANSDVNLSVASEAAKREVLLNGGNTADADKAAKEVVLKSQTLKVQDNWSLTGVKLGIPIKYWLIDQTLNKVTFDYSYSQEFNRNPIYENQFSWIWRTKVGYNLSISEFLAFQPLKWAENIPVLDEYSKWKLNLLPTNFTTSIIMSRKRNTEQSRFLEFPSPVVRDFAANVTAQFNWKLSQDGFLSPSIDYNLSTLNNMAKFELDENGRQRTGTEITKFIFFQNGKILDLGQSATENQNITINVKPKIPNIFGLNKFLTMTGSFITDYYWTDPLQPDSSLRDISKKAGFKNTIRFNTKLGLQALADSWFGTGPVVPMTPRKDTSASVLRSIGLLFKFIFLEYQNIDFTLNQTNNATNPGVIGGNGLTNLWGRALTGRSSLDMYGPTVPYQLGLVTSPSGNIGLRSSSAFPFFAFQTYEGLRPSNGIMQDNFTQKTTFEIKTSRPLWDGAKLDINWKSELGYNRNETVVTLQDGKPTYQNVIALQSLNRTFISFPKFFGINLFHNDIESIMSRYKASSANIIANATDTLTKNQNLQTALSDAFYGSLEAFSLSGQGNVSRFLPSLNWGFSWEGLEKLPLFKEIAKKIRVEHIYTSTYDESVQLTDHGKIIQNQQVNYGFSPLVRVNATFDEKKLNGVLTATIDWNVISSYNLNSAARSTISENSSSEIKANANYKIKGFKWKLLGLDLENDLEYIFLFSFKKTNRAVFDVLDSTSLNGGSGRQLTGDKQIVIEPRVRYAMSNRVTASAFFRYETTITAGAANPGFSTTQFGVDVRISIAGGR